MRPSIVSFLLLITSSWTFAAEELPLSVEKFIEQVKATNAKQIDRYKNELAELEKRRRSESRSLTRNDKLKIIEDIEKTKAGIASIMKGEWTIPDLEVFEPTVGTLGKLPPSVEFTVSQVLDESTLQVVPTGTRTRISFSGLRSSQSFYKHNGEPLLIRGLSTAGFADNSKFSSTLTYEVLGTESYESVGGSRRTVFVLTPIDLDKWLPEIRNGLSASQAEPRKWESGAYSVTATYVEYSNNNVTLRKKDGTEIAVPFTKLSRADQAYVRQRIAENKSIDK